MLNFKLLSLMFLAFVGTIGIALPYPVISPLILRGELPQLFNLSPMMSVMLVLALYPLGQFLASPIMGAYSDKLGARKIVSFSMILTALGYLGSGYAIANRDILLFCLTRFLTGLSEGNFSLLRAELSRSPETRKNPVKAFSYLNASASFGWLIAPVLGGFLSSPEVHPSLSFETPFLFGSLISLLGVFLAFFTLQKKTNQPKTKESILTSLKSVWKLPFLAQMLFLSFTIRLAIDGFYEFLPAFITEVLKGDGKTIALHNLIVTAGITVTPILFSSLIHKSSWSFLLAALFCAFGLSGLSSYESETLIAFSLLVVGSSIGVLTTLIPAFVSENSPREQQGAIMGSMDSLRSLGNVLVCLFLGFLGDLNLQLPFFFIAFIMVLGAERFGRLKRKLTQQKESCEIVGLPTE